MRGNAFEVEVLRADVLIAREQESITAEKLRATILELHTSREAQRRMTRSNAEASVAEQAELENLRGEVLIARERQTNAEEKVATILGKADADMELLRMELAIAQQKQTMAEER